MYQIKLGDIVKEQVDAIVNAANTSLLGGGGVDGAIHRAAGPELLKECSTLNGCKTGAAKITKGYQLAAQYVIHTPGPIWQDGHHGEDTLLKNCYQSCLNLAVEYGLTSIAFPSISTGVYHFPLERAADIATQTILDFLETHPSMNVSMICFDEYTEAAYVNALKKDGRIL